MTEDIPSIDVHEEAGDQEETAEGEHCWRGRYDVDGALIEKNSTAGARPIA